MHYLVRHFGCVFLRRTAWLSLAPKWPPRGTRRCHLGPKMNQHFFETHLQPTSHTHTFLFSFQSGVFRHHLLHRGRYRHFDPRGTETSFHRRWTWWTQVSEIFHDVALPHSMVHLHQPLVTGSLRSHKRILSGT